MHASEFGVEMDRQQCYILPSDSGIATSDAGGGHESFNPGRAAMNVITANIRVNRMEARLRGGNVTTRGRRGGGQPVRHLSVALV